ncbi:ribonuclease H-like domain-containing protein, partial [Tanacetum coccineum]
MDKCKTRFRYNVVPPPYTMNFMPPKPDLVYPSLDDLVEVNESVSESIVEKPTVETNEPETARKENGAPIIKDWVSDSDEENMPKGNPHQDLKEKEVIDSGCFRHMTGNRYYLTDYEEIDRGFVAFGVLLLVYFNTANYHGFINTAANGIDVWFWVKRRISRHQHVLIDKETTVEILVLLDLKGRISTTGHEVSTASFKLINNAGLIFEGTSLDPSWSELELHLSGDKFLRSIDLQGGRCMRVFDYKEVTRRCLEALELKGVDGGAFKLLGDVIEVLGCLLEVIKVLIKLSLNDHMVSTESVSQMCDKKNSVLFIDTECVVLSLDFKLTDENHVLLKVPRKDNMYSVDLKNVIPQGGLTCLFAKATPDESNLWHRRLGHVNFKTMNKL